MQQTNRINTNLRSPREIIESVSHPELEEIWAKLPRKELESISTERGKSRVRGVYSHKGRYTLVHTHPHIDSAKKYPASFDFIDFFCNYREKGMAVAQTNPQTGKLIGYYVVKKTEATPEINSFVEIIDLLLCGFSFGLYKGRAILSNFINSRYKGDEEEYRCNIEKLMLKYHLQHKYLPNQKHDAPPRLKSRGL